MRISAYPLRAIKAAFLTGLILIAAYALSRTQSAEEPVEDQTTAVNEQAEPVTIVRIPPIQPFRYQVDGRRDPFIPLVSTDMDESIPSIASLSLTGILWNRNESLAILEDQKGQGYPMRVGDRLGNATLVGIKDDAVIFRVVLYGEVHMHTLKLQFEEEK